jgi:phage tail sheath protein FI
MPVTPTYPGIYIEEIPSSVHTIAAAPTNIAVFIGYTHPFKTLKFGKAILLFSFTDFERNFGGFFDGPIFSPPKPKPTDTTDNFFGSLPLAINQFFLNGGTMCYVVGLEAKFGGTALKPGSVNIGGITFTARELTDSTQQMLITITPNGANPSSPPSSPPQADTADITITYGSGAGAMVEVYRKVSLDKIRDIIGTDTKPQSSLVTVPTSGSLPLSYTASTNQALSSVAWSPPLSITPDFQSVFQKDSSLDKVSIFNLMVLPGVTSNIVLSEALAFCETKRAFLIMDPPPPPDEGTTLTGNEYFQLVEEHINTNAPLAPNTAIYFPYIKSNYPETGKPIELPPAGTVAGIFARTDLNRGVWKAPAGLETTILGTTGVVPAGEMSDLRQGQLNIKAINCLRSFPGVGTVVFGARTSVAANTSQQQWKYVPVRRMALFLEQTLYTNLGWVVFEPNDDPLWTAIRNSIEAFMLGLFRQGAFQGSKPSEAFQVKCDNQTTTQADIDNGIVNIVVAFAPLKPAEFVIIKIAQLAGQTQTA